MRSIVSINRSHAPSNLETRPFPSFDTSQALRPLDLSSYVSGCECCQGGGLETRTRPLPLWSIHTIPDKTIQSNLVPSFGPLSVPVNQSINQDWIYRDNANANSNTTRYLELFFLRYRGNWSMRLVSVCNCCRDSSGDRSFQWKQKW